jgi:hypothetical protein
MEIINITDEIIEINVTEAVVNVVTQTGAYPLPSNVFSVFGRVGNVVGQLGDYTTSIVAEGTNLYYTDARSRAAISENITGMEYSSASGIFSLTSGYVIPTQAILDAKVPYTGATGNVTLGEHQLTAGQVAFDQTPTGSAGVGVMRWNDTDGTLDLGLKGGNVTLQVGQEMVARVVNKTGADLLEANYQVVRISSAQGQRLAVQLAQANNDASSTDTIGIVTETITNNQEGFITILGQVKEINTTGSLQGETWADGDVLYLSPTTAGKITNVKPSAPQHMVVVGYVEYAHSQHGKIYCKVQNGYELEELHDVAPLPYIDKGVLYRDTATNLWKSATIGTLLGYTPVTSARTISTTAPLTGGGDLSADRTLSMPAATTSANGYLTSTDWNTFNGKQPLIAAGTTAQYYRGDKTFQTLNTTAVAEGTNLYYTAARFNTAFSGKTTTDLAEGTNLYYTDARARAAISGTLPISVSSGVVSITQAGGAANGYLSSTDWNTFNNKQAALNGTGFVKISGTTISYDNSTYLTTIEGITAGGELSGTYASPSLVNSAVTGKILSGVNITGGTISDTDSILTAFGKLQNQVNGLIGGSIYKGTWNATTNTPTIASGVGTKGNYYIVSVSGTTTIDGISDWNVGDWIIYDGTAWQQVDNTDAVVSVNGETGAVSLTTSNIAEGTNLYFTNARAIASTLTGYTSGAGTISSSDTILQAIQKLNGNVSGLVTGVSSVFGRTGAVTAASGDYTTTQVTEGTNLYYTDVRVSANSDVAANTAARHSAVTLGTANGLSLSTQQLSLAAASSSTTGALTSTDWNTFNGKQAALNGTGFVKISGTTISYDNSTYLTTSAASSTYLPLAGGTLTGALSGTSATFSGNSYLATSSGDVGVGTTTPNLTAANRKVLDINGTTESLLSFSSGGTNKSYIFNDGTNLITQGATLKFQTGYTDRLTIAASGAATFANSVTAAGTSTTPTFWAKGGMDGSGTGKGNIRSSDSGGTNYFDFGRDNLTTGNFVLTSNGGSPLLSITTSGAATFSYSATFGSDVFTYNNGGIFFSGGGSYTTGIFQNSNGLNLQAGGSPKVTITSGGSVGIRSTNPEQPLHINQGISGFNQGIPGTSGTTQNGILRLSAGQNTFGECLDFGMNVATTYAWIQATNAGNLSVNYNLALNPNGGSVGVGTNDIQGLLDVYKSNSGGLGGYMMLRNNGAAVGNETAVMFVDGGADSVRAAISSTTGNSPYFGDLKFKTGAGSYGSLNTKMIITGGGTLGIAGSEDVWNAGLDKISIGHLSGSYGWIQTWNATSLYLNKIGNAVYAGTQRIDNNSDARIKENVAPIENALNVVLSLKGRKFNMLDEDNILRYGFIAQEVQPHIADFVTESDRKFEKDDIKIENLLTLESSGAAWGALLVEAIKEQQAQIEELKAKILSL